MNRREFLRSTLVIPAASAGTLGVAFAADETEGRPAQKGVEAKTVPTGLNPRLRAIRCLRCKKVYPLSSDVADTGKGCPECLAQGYPVDVTFSYAPATRKAFAKSGPGITRYRDLLPLLDFPTLSEGDTPLVPLTALARKLGLSALLAKDESRGPTGSHKDRTSGLIVARGRS